jgi:oligoribonuclease NrnB/cAMP/cGMP phosphodiesterase (DHH superfamily)
VQAIAHAHFSGGGHHNAAGGMVEGVPLAQVVERLEALLPKWAEDLTYELGW